MKNILKLGSVALALPLMLAPHCQAQRWSGGQNLGGSTIGVPLFQADWSAGSDHHATLIAFFIERF